MGNNLMNGFLWALWIIVAVIGVLLAFEGVDNDNGGQLYGGIALMIVGAGMRFAARRRR